MTRLAVGPAVRRVRSSTGVGESQSSANARVGAVSGNSSLKSHFPQDGFHILAETMTGVKWH